MQVCTLWKETVLQDHPKLRTRKSSAVTEEGASWLAHRERTVPGKPCSQETAATSSQELEGEETILPSPEICKSESPLGRPFLDGVFQHLKTLSGAGRLETRLLQTDDHSQIQTEPEELLLMLKQERNQVCSC